jgi:hypothetical protein
MSIRQVALIDFIILKKIRKCAIFSIFEIMKHLELTLY